MPAGRWKGAGGGGASWWCGGPPSTNALILAFVLPLSLFVETLVTASRVADDLDERFLREMEVNRAIMEEDEEDDDREVDEGEEAEEDEEQAPVEGKEPVVIGAAVAATPTRTRNRPRRQILFIYLLHVAADKQRSEMARQQGVASMLALALVLGTFAAIPTGVQSIGVCYGVNGDNLPPANEVVQLYQSNGINLMRIYFADTNALKALSGSNIGLIMDVPNDQLGSIASDPNNAANWVRDNIQAFPGVSFRYIAVGNEVSGGDTNNILPAMQNINNALSNAGLGSIKVSTAVQSGVTQGFPPSQGSFSQGYMGPIAQFLQSTGAPLLANIYPYFAYTGNEQQINLNYALFTAPGTVVQDGNNAYQNLFDALVDTMYSALENAGAGNVNIVVSESGWPSAGGDAASTGNAQTYNQNLINHVGQGTPKRPGAIETYIFAMFNEDQKQGLETERHFGLFNPDKSAAYPINFN
ncbi:Glucan endo-1,3-beta-glucosidase, acidic isoform [Dichanthelium oligosanthes]|uniref:Glucan endo-1,3-beta-glucosidase, acidic isoform n=1 Tax=Dichanthelium oligosanthes TaxID=888268 RepID=A0A1E5WK50_9POAL|nr:Glucan endo-1,3-beta-glucosidase, acidic isoform [Dichanthelium oligosanthes]